MLSRVHQHQVEVLIALTIIVFCAGQPRAKAATTVQMHSGSDVVSLVRSSPAGTTFVFSAGTYRMQSPIEAKTGDVFVGPCSKPPCSASNQAVLNGARLLTSFERSGSYYYVTGQTQQGKVTMPTSACMSGYPGCIYPEDLYFDNVPLIHVISLSDVGPGKWYFDYPTHTIYFYDNPNGHTVETSVTPAAFTPGPANNVTVKGLTIEKYATPLGTGAVGGVGLTVGNQTAGANWVVESNEISLNHAGGVRINYGWQVLNNFIHTNGNVGIGGGMGYSGMIPSRVVIQGNEISYNNYAYVTGNMGAGGIKVLSTRGIIIRDNYVHNNNGTGIHLDTDNYTALIDHNTVTDNTLGGVGFEISYGGTVRNNSLLRNGYVYTDGTSWLYGAQLLSSTTQNVEAYCNTAEMSAQGGTGLNMIVQTRGPGENALSSNNYYHHNTLVFDGDSGITGGAFGAPSIAYEFVNNRYDYNDYHYPNLSRKLISWHAIVGGTPHDTANTFSEFKADGQETHGTADTLYTSSVPNVTITSPADQSTVSGIVDIAGTASDSSLSKVEFYVDWALQSTTSSDSFSFAWNTNDVEAGAHTIAALAYSSEGIRNCYAVTLNVK